MTRLPFWDHVEDLRRALIRSGWALLLTTLLVFSFHTPIFKWLLKPLGLQELYLFSPLEGFSTAVKLSFWMAVILSSPIWVYSLLCFLLPGMRRRERRLVIPFIGLSLLFITLGLLFGYTFTLPLTLNFFQKFNGSFGENLWGLRETTNFIITLLLAHALVFELYVGLLFCIHFRLLSYSLLKRGRRGVIVGIFIVAAALTPPDVVSQILLALPMLVFYESAIFYAKIKRVQVQDRGELTG